MSRSAWDEEPIEAGDVLGATPMSDELYVAKNLRDKAIGDLGERRKQIERRRKAPPREDQSCGASIKRGLGGLWSTRMTLKPEEEEADQELIVRTTLRELVVYVVYLIIICVLTFGMTSESMYHYTTQMMNLFLDKTTVDGGSISFRTLVSQKQWWEWAEKPMLDGLYWETWYNGKNKSEHNYVLHENKMLGVPRLRQLRVRNDSCAVHDDFKDNIKFCYDAYNNQIEETDPFGPGNGTAWTYQSEDELDGSGHSGALTTYQGGGYVQSLARDKKRSEEILAYLKANLWLGRPTRAVFLDFTVYNANINLFCVVRLVAEFPPTGGVVTSFAMKTVKLLRYVSMQDYIVLACEGIFVLFIAYYIVEEAIEIRRHKLPYFKDFWNILDCFVIGISCICITFNAYRTMAITSMLEKLLLDPDGYPDFEFLGYWQMQFNYAIAVAVFASWVKVFKYISFNKTMTQLSETIGGCAKDLAGFAVMFTIIFFAFAQLGYLIFGTQVQGFSTFPRCIFTLFRIILGDFDFQALEDAHRFLGPAYFILYVFFVFFVLLNMFLAIINDTYSEVKSELETRESEFEMADFFKNKYSKVLSKLNLKRDKITEIQAALRTADKDGDKQVDFAEWSADMMKRGFTESELRAVFTKYDTDGDGIMDEEEQRKMVDELIKQRDEIDQQVDEVERNEEMGDVAMIDDDDSSFMDDGSQPKTRVPTVSGGAHANKRGHEKRRDGPTDGGVSYQEFTVLSRRVDRMEHSIGAIVSKIDAVLVKLEAMEKTKKKRQEGLGKMLDQIETSYDSEAQKREMMEQLVREELDKWNEQGNEAARRGASKMDTRAPSKAESRAASKAGSGSSGRMSKLSTGF